MKNIQIIVFKDILSTTENRSVIPSQPKQEKEKKASLLPFQEIHSHMKRKTSIKFLL